MKFEKERDRNYKLLLQLERVRKEEDRKAKKVDVAVEVNFITCDKVPSHYQYRTKPETPL